jgi:hypothetical protein
VPGKSGSDPVIEPPVSSIRWEMLREGVEDYEMLYLLRQRLAEKQTDAAGRAIAKPGSSCWKSRRPSRRT